MLIRCEKCRALFSLPETVGEHAGAGFAGDGQGPKGGALMVQCARCQLVFPVPERRGSSAAKPAPVPSNVTQRRSRGWQAPALLAVAVALLIFAFLEWRSQQPHLTQAAAARLEQGEKLLLRDDLASLDQATKLFTDAAHLAPRVAQPEAERALALLLQSQTRTQLQDPAATRYLQQGVAAARAAVREAPRDPIVLRAVALAQALSGAPEDATRTLDSVASDAWVEYVRATAATEPQSALAALDAALKLQPQLLRAEVDEARLLLPAAPQRAKDLLGHVLSENPRHELAQRLAK
jgi:hypothetical protein